jgi:hypothetical protein
MTDQSISSNRIAFLEISAFDDGSIRGGVLVTDTFSRPYEFRVTSPIKPNNLQKILYGKSLPNYLFGELLCLPLLKQVKENISLAVCQNEYLLVARPELKFPFVYLQKNETPSQNDQINSVLIKAHRNYSGEKPQAEVFLNTLAKDIDLFEPFERVKLALSEVHTQKN